MFGQATYLLWLLIFIGLPLLVLGGLAWRSGALQRRWRALAWTTAGSLAGGWAWDAWAVQVGVWFYKAENISGIWFWGLPLEEWLWIIGVTWMFGLLTLLLAEGQAAKEGA